jgi:membrane protein required for colicin V production
MNWLDIVLAIFLVISIIGGIANGLIKSVFSLAGLIVGVVLAGRYYSSLADHLPFITNERAASIVGFIIIFLVVVIVASILGAIFTKVVSDIMLGWINRLGGAVFSFFTGALFMAAVLAIWVKYSGENSSISGSYLASVLLDRFPLVLGLLPPEFDIIRRFFQG